MILSAASAPSNIALIKYMGKTSRENFPANASLSYALENYRTFVELEKISGEADEWRALVRQGLFPIELSNTGREKFLKHLARLKAHFSLNEAICIHSANNFPSDCGLASSASSFAALTLAVGHFAGERDPLTLAKLSRLGSGSSCRSFFSPWCEWDGDDVGAVSLPQRRMRHFVLLLDQTKKRVSSSEAHRRVTTSLLFRGRPPRANLRLRQLKNSLLRSAWKDAYEICWAEFWDMHVLFETSAPHFSYLERDGLGILRRLENLWAADGDGPLITMDAGPNIHLLFREDQDDLCQRYRTIFESHVDLSPSF